MTSKSKKNIEQKKRQMYKKRWTYLCYLFSAFLFFLLGVYFYLNNKTPSDAKKIETIEVIRSLKKSVVNCPPSFFSHMLEGAIEYGGKDALFAKVLQNINTNYHVSSKCFLAIPCHYIVETRIRWQKKTDYFEQAINTLKQIQMRGAQSESVRFSMVFFQSSAKQIMKLALELNLVDSLYSLYPAFKRITMYNSRGDDIVTSISIPLIPTKNFLYQVPPNIERTVFFAGKCTHPLRCLISEIPTYPGWDIEPCYFCKGGNDLVCKSTLDYKTYKEKMQKNLFILVPVGTFRNSFRLTEAIQLGRIPIIIFTTKYKHYHTCSVFSRGCCAIQVQHFNQRKTSRYNKNLLTNDDSIYLWRTHTGVWLPFRDRIDWTKAAIFIEDVNLYNIGNIINSMDDDEINARLQYISQISHMFNIEYVKHYILNDNTHIGNFDVPFSKGTLEKTLAIVISYSHHIIQDHRKEIELCIVANLENKYINLVLIIYDSYDATHNCKTLTNMLDNVGANVFKLNCINRSSRQPNYYEMLEYAMNAPTDVSILANADIVFDETIQKAYDIRENNIVALSVTGGVAESPNWLKNIYLNHMENTPNKNPGKCKDTNEDPYHSWPDKLFSIDAFIMHNGQYLDKKMFLNIHGKHYGMNTMGGELAASGALFQHGYKITNACKHINAWHWHQTVKTHPSVKESRLYAPYGIYKEKYQNKPISKKTVFRNIRKSEAHELFHLPHGCELLNECLH